MRSAHNFDEKILRKNLLEGSGSEDNSEDGNKVYECNKRQEKL
jgi:hypothetical protein